MEVYIPDIDIPAPGEVLYFVQDRETGKVLIQVGSTDKELKAVPIPPHGRLIDADDLANSITGAIYHSDLRDAPTVIPAEEGK